MPDTLRSAYDAIVVGSGPNGLSAAIAIARAGRSVLVVEAHNIIGGGTRTLPLTLPGFRHDVCSAIHPLGMASPYWKTLPLDKHGLEWIQPPIPFAHPLDGGTAAIQEISIESTASRLGNDGPTYQKLFTPLTAAAATLFSELLGPFRIPLHFISATRFGWNAIRSATSLAARFHGIEARALISGLAAHSIIPLENRPSAAITLMLGLAGHAVGWPLPRGGSQSIADALASYLDSLGGEIVTDWRVKSISELPAAKAVLLDVSPKVLLEIAGSRLTHHYQDRLRRFRHGPGVFKVDWALSEPIPWEASDCKRAGTVHVGGTFEEIAASERAAWNGEMCVRPFVLVTQPSLFDPSRAPPGQHTAWGYCHVPNGSQVDMTHLVELQVERFAPGFRECILARATRGPAELEKDNPNYVGGDIAGGVTDLTQLFTRPVAKLNPYVTSDPSIFICSASTPPGAGVHGMCGYFAAQAALKLLKSHS
jgi:phytoene dehydrogenase-like protein